MGQKGHFYAETHGDGLNLASDQEIKGLVEVGLSQFDFCLIAIAPTPLTLTKKNKINLDTFAPCQPDKTF